MARLLSGTRARSLARSTTNCPCLPAKTIEPIALAQELTLQCSSTVSRMPKVNVYHSNFCFVGLLSQCVLPVPAHRLDAAVHARSARSAEAPQEAALAVPRQAETPAAVYGGKPLRDWSVGEVAFFCSEAGSAQGEKPGVEQQRCR